MARRSDHSKEELEALIIQTAEKIISEEGYNALTARRLSSEIGYTPGTIYIFFKSLDDLILKINVLTLEKIYQALSKAINSSKDCPETAIKKIAEAYLDYAQKNLQRWEVIYEFNYNKDLPDWYLNQVEKIFNMVDALIAELVSDSKQARLYTQVFWAGIHGVTALALTGKYSNVKSNAPAKNILKLFVDNFIAGLKSC